MRADPLRHLRDGVLAIVAGIGMAGASWAMLTRDGTSLSRYYLENSVSGGGGTNVVNVILVDFRGFDTFGEITVLGIAALAIYALLDGALFGRHRPPPRGVVDRPPAVGRPPSDDHGRRHPGDAAAGDAGRRLHLPARHTTSPAAASSPRWWCRSR